MSSTRTLFFNYHMFEDNVGSTPNMGSLEVLAETTEGLTYSCFFAEKNHDDVWREASVTLPPNTNVIIFRGVTGPGFKSDICIADFYIDKAID